VPTFDRELWLSIGALVIAIISLIVNLVVAYRRRGR
jgi:hypothetical protein